jgi:hypothetical protein
MTREQSQICIYVVSGVNLLAGDDTGVGNGPWGKRHQKVCAAPLFREMLCMSFHRTPAQLGSKADSAWEVVP